VLPNDSSVSKVLAVSFSRAINDSVVTKVKEVVTKVKRVKSVN
jgi:hypothetical protein